jgi:hypothetical protein
VAAESAATGHTETTYNNPEGLPSLRQLQRRTAVAQRQFVISPYEEQLLDSG